MFLPFFFQLVGNFYFRAGGISPVMREVIEDAVSKSERPVFRAEICRLDEIF